MKIERMVRILLASLFILAGLASAYAQITPSGDAYTNTASPTINFGAKPLLDVESASQTAFIQFDLSSIPTGYTSANVTKATLKLYVNAVTTAGSFNVDFVDGTWSEKTITANLSPALGTTIAASVPLTTGNVHDYILIDVTSAVGAWLDGTQANDGIALVANSPLNASFDSKENTTNSHSAELDIVFSGKGTITGVNTAVGSGLTGGGTSGTLNLSLLKSCGSGQVLAWNGSAWACKTMGGTGTVTSVGLSAPPLDFVVTGSPVTSSGSLVLSWTIPPTSANVPNAIVKRDSTGSLNANDITASGQIFVANGSGVNPLHSLASAANAAAIEGDAIGTGNTDGVLGTSSGTGAGSAGVQGTDNNTAGGSYTAGVSGYTANPIGMGVLGIGKTLSNVGNSRLGTAAAGVWADSTNFGLVATSDLNAVVAYNNSTGATIFGENDTTSASGYLLYATAPKVTSNGHPATCLITTHADLGCNGDLKADGALQLGQDATQPATANGLVKAMFFFDSTNSQIAFCFNSQLTGAAATTPPCGIGVQHTGQGKNVFDLGFTIAARVIQVTAANFGASAGRPVVVNIDNVSGSSVSTSSYYGSDENLTDVPLYLTVF